MLTSLSDIGCGGDVEDEEVRMRTLSNTRTASVTTIKKKDSTKKLLKKNKQQNREEQNGESALVGNNC